MTAARNDVAALVRRTRTLLVALVSLGLAAAVAAPAVGSPRASSQALTAAGLKWSAPFQLFTGPAAAICTRFSLCLAWSANRISTSTAPAATPRAWHRPVAVRLSALTCPSRRLCVGIDDRSVVVSSDPTRAWSVSSSLAPKRIPHSPDHNYLTSISCPSVHLCVAGDFAGQILISTHPAARKQAWSAPIRIAPVAAGDISDISCPSVHLCVAFAGQLILTSTKPAADRTVWRSRPSRAAGPSGLVCPSIHLCIGFDAEGNIFTSRDPTGGRGAWGPPLHVDSAAQLDDISCPSSRMCVAVDAAGNAQSIDPAGARQTWSQPRLIDPNPASGGQNQQINSIACPSARLCVAVDQNGNVIVGRAG